MASGDPFQVEDQTDEDFFDKLVGDDEFGLGSDAAAGDMARALSNMSLGDVGTSVDSFEVENKHGDEKLLESKSHEKCSLVRKEIAPAELCNIDALDEAVQSGNLVKDEIEEGSPGSSAGKSTGSKGTSIKVVQWSSFSSGQGQLDMCGYGSYSDFLTGVPGASATELVTSTDDKSTVTDVNASFGSFETQDIQDLGVTCEQMTNLVLSEQIDSQAYGASNEQVTSGNDSQYWANAYPGWTYDANTGQWYQVDNYAATKDAQADGYGSSVANYQESLLAGIELADDGVASVQTSEISYLQQTAQSVVETVTDDCTTSNVSNWNQVPNENIEYPSNMVFDPQYPGWYYDQNTLQWYTLESYTQSLQTMTNGAQSEQAQDVRASLGGHFSDQGLNLYNNEAGQLQIQALGSQSPQEQGDWSGYRSNYNHGNSWQPDQDDKSQTAFVFSGDKMIDRDFYNLQSSDGNYVDQQPCLQTTGNVQKPLYDHSSSSGTNSFSAFMPVESSYQFNQSRVEHLQHGNASQSYYQNQNSVNYSQQFSQSGTASYSQFSYAPNGGRPLEGRPPHALVTFGFGGKLIVMKDITSFGTNISYGSQDAGKGEISLLNLAEVVLEKTDSSALGNLSCDYFQSLCRQSFPGPLVGGNATTKDLNKWLDERITSCESSTLDFRKGELLRLLFSLLKISCQHYGKLRSPFGVDPSLQEADGPELAVTKLFASARKNSDQLREYGAITHCMHNLPSEGQIRKTAVEVQHLLVSGRRKEALQCAQEGQLWGPALVLAAQLGDKFYIDTVKQMAHHQFVSGSPLRTLCLLIAGQPADVFSMDSSNNNLPGAVNVAQQPMQVSASGMLDDWEENLAIITANRTKDDELVIIHLGDCLWKERGEVTAAHTCYLVAEAKFESYSDKARLCLIGADHWKCPRTYASPEAIQRTELYEYSKVLGNSQFILLPFQPYKLVYAYMLAEVGKVSDALKYCQAILKSLKSSGRDPEVETWKGLVSSLEERLRGHQQGGYSTNLAPAKLVGKLFTSIDRSLHRMIGAPPPPLPPTHPNHSSVHDNISMASKVGSSQSTMAMSSLLPSASVETISEWTGDSRKIMHNRSISEPDFGRSPKQINPSGDGSSADLRSKAPGASRLGLFGAQFFQKTIGWMARSRQAKLGEKNKFYYDEKLKRWVEEGAEPPAEEAALPPPPTTASFQNHAPEYTTKNAVSSENISSNGMLETKSSSSTEHSPGIPPMPPMQNQFSARGRMGVRSRYVDTFNKVGGMPTASFQSPSVPSVKPVGGAKFFIPSPVAASESTADSTESTQVASRTVGDSASVGKESSFSPLPSSSFTMQRFPSMDNIPSTRNKGMGTPSQNGNGSLSSRSRAASWSGSYSDAFNHKMADTNPSGEGLGVPSSFTTRSPSPLQPTTSLHTNGSSLSDDLHEVEL